MLRAMVREAVDVERYLVWHDEGGRPPGFFRELQEENVEIIRGNQVARIREIAALFPEDPLERTESAVARMAALNPWR